MNDRTIVAEKITKPIQLLAAWLVGLIAVNGSFLLGAQHIVRPDWVSGLLVVAAVVNVPIFIGALFLLQTKFRPQMQEDSYYSRFLEREERFTQVARPSTVAVVESEVKQASERIVQTLGPAAVGKEEPIAAILRESQFELLVARHGGSRALSELFLSPETWRAVVKEFGKDDTFVRDIDGLLEDGLATKKYKGYTRAALTGLGRKVAQQAQVEEKLFSQTRPQMWIASRELLRLTTDSLELDGEKEGDA